MANFQFDFDQYERLLKAVAAMSKLYSDNKKPYVDSRFIEKLFVHTSKAKDFGRDDMSFDAVLLNNIGVGIKTFSVNNFIANKSEKIAEMTRYATNGLFKDLNLEKLAIKTAELRNKRVESDVNEFGIDIDKCFYHCLVRSDGQAMVHEEPYVYIDVSSIKPTDKYGNEIPNFSKYDSANPHFTDGRNQYTYSVAKNTLFKRFELSSYNNSSLIDIEIYDDIFTKVLTWFNEDSNNFITEVIDQDKFVVMPLYGYEGKEKKVFPKSGLNQWNAGGRERSFGESYILAPKAIHNKSPNFFPGKDVQFELILPNKKKVIAKMCQDGSKALMANPNTDLFSWLFRIIDGVDSISKKRLINSDPYTYDDLRLIGKDSVKVLKRSNLLYELSMLPLGSYEEFIDGSLGDIDSQKDAR